MNKVAGVKVGKRVSVLATKAKAEGWCKHHWPGTWKTERLVGTVVAKVDKLWRVRWDEHYGAGECTLSARTLEDAPPPNVAPAVAAVPLAAGAVAALLAQGAPVPVVAVPHPAAALLSLPVLSSQS